MPNPLPDPPGSILPPLPSFFLSVDVVLGLLVLAALALIMLHMLIVAFFVKFRYHSGDDPMEIIQAAPTLEEAPFVPSSVKDPVLIRTVLRHAPQSVSRLRWERLQFNNVENGLVFLPNLLLVAVGSAYWQGLTSLQYNHIFMLVLVGYYFLGRVFDTFLVLRGHRTMSSHVVTGINGVSIFFAFLGTTGATVTLGPMVSGPEDPNLNLIGFCWAILLLMIKCEVIGWNRRKLSRRIERALYPTLQDEERNEKLHRFERAIRSEFESLLPFFLLSYLWLNSIPSSFNPVPGSFEVMVAFFLITRYAHTYALFWRHPTLRLLSWAFGIFILVALAGWLVTLESFSASGRPGAYQIDTLAFVLLVLHQVFLSVLTERARYASGVPQVPEDTVRLFVSVQPTPNLNDLDGANVTRLQDDHLESLEHTLIALLATLFGLKPIITLLGKGSLVVVLPAMPLFDWLTAGCLLALVGSKALSSVVMAWRRGLSKYSYAFTALILLFYIGLVSHRLARWLHADEDAALFAPLSPQ